ncbi:hypothetical protein E2C01_004631 [Portunus trituberculatus]|uniref:Uncharacterized protein n=1 Tax=Portunus trituberculatus TaxID=210409 RepID=A0A5B7CWX8_PORTR|nr:hypothetical protein [Portunus trituberculatus]
MMTPVAVVLAAAVAAGAAIPEPLLDSNAALQCCHSQYFIERLPAAYGTVWCCWVCCRLFKFTGRHTPCEFPGTFTTLPATQLSIMKLDELFAREVLLWRYVRALGCLLVLQVAVPMAICNLYYTVIVQGVFNPVTIVTNLMASCILPSKLLQLEAGDCHSVILTLQQRDVLNIAGNGGIVDGSKSLRGGKEYSEGSLLFQHWGKPSACYCHIGT